MGRLRREHARQLRRVDLERAVVAARRREAAAFDVTEDRALAAAGVFRRFTQGQEGHCTLSHGIRHETVQVGQLSTG
jgi:hypothetical protein